MKCVRAALPGRRTLRDAEDAEDAEGSAVLSLHPGRTFPAEVADRKRLSAVSPKVAHPAARRLEEVGQWEDAHVEVVRESDASGIHPVEFVLTSR